MDPAGGRGNLLLAAVVMISAFAISFTVAWFLGYEQPDEAAVADITGESG